MIRFILFIILYLYVFSFVFQDELIEMCSHQTVYSEEECLVRVTK